MKMNEDVVEEILLRIPAQTLMRCKCVCKKWCDMIQSSDFLNKRRHNRRIIMVNYLKYAKYSIDDFLRYGKNFLSCYDNYDEFLTRSDDVELSSDFSYRGWFKLATHSNGIVCMTDYQDFSPIILFNPSLRRLRLVPPCPFSCPNPHQCPCPNPKPYDHTFDPDGLCAVGFGFDDTINNYKVVRIVLLSFYTDIEAQVYDLSTDCWRKSSRIHINIEYNCSPLCPPIFFNGMLHYIVRELGMIDDDGLMSITNKIITFNITTELFEIMEFPHNWENYPLGENLMYFNSCLLAMDESTLALVAFNNYPWHYESNSCSQLHVWVMKEYGVRESWIKQYSVMWESNTRIGKPLSFLNRDELLIITADGMLICYNLVTGEERHLRQYRFPTAELTRRLPDSSEYLTEVVIPEGVVCTFGVVICDESLVPV